MRNIIQVTIKNVYGNETIYPVTHAAELRALTGCKTLTAAHLRALVNMGFEFEDVSKSGEILSRLTAADVAESAVSHV